MYEGACGFTPSRRDSADANATDDSDKMLTDGQGQSGKPDTVPDSDPGSNDTLNHRRSSKVGSLALSASERRSRFHKQHHTEVKSVSDASEKGSLTPAMRKRYLKDLFLNQNSHSGLSTILSLSSGSRGSRYRDEAQYEESAALWALDPTEHAWMLAVVDGNYDTMVEFLSEDPELLIRKDFISGYTALHWLAKSGRHDVLIRLLKHAERQGYPLNINIRGSGGLTPLHVAALHSHHMVMKVLVGAFGSSVDVMDYNGKRAWQYLKESAPPEMKELLGMWDDEHATYWQMNTNNNCAGSSLAPHVADSHSGTDVLEICRPDDGWRGTFRKLLSPFISRWNKDM